MNDSTPSPKAATEPIAGTAVWTSMPVPSAANAPSLAKSAARTAGAIPDLPAFFAALGNPLRWQMVKTLADGSAHSASFFAQNLQRNFDGVSKHLRVPLAAGVVVLREGTDKSYALYAIPEGVRREGGVLDYGSAVIRLE